MRATPTPATCSMTRQPTSSSSQSRRRTAIPFFVVIDYDAPINEDEEQYQTYFLNMVDESDLLALLDEDTAAALTTCNCKEKCAAGQVNTDCPVCKTNMSECTGTAPVTPEPDKDDRKRLPPSP